MDYFVKKVSSISEEESYPDWVDAKNASLQAYQATKAAREEKLKYIFKSTRKSHFKVKKNYQIVGSEIARGIGIAKTTLLNSSSYSAAYSQHLSDINEELAKAADHKIENAKKNRSRGAISKTKKELVSKAQTDKQRIAELEKANAEEQVKAAFSHLTPAIRRLLYLPAIKPEGNVIKL
jgi:hypothetical protein